MCNVTVLELTFRDLWVLVQSLCLLPLSCLSLAWLCVTPETAAHQAPLSLGFSRQEHWRGLPFPSSMHESETWKWSCSVVSNSLRPHGPQARQASLSIINSQSLFKLMSIESVRPFNHLILCHPFLPSPSIFPGSFPMSRFFTSRGQSIEASASASVLPMSSQDWFPLGLTVGSPCSPRDPQESSPMPQFKSINSSVLSFLYSPTLTSIHDYWKNHSFD